MISTTFWSHAALRSTLMLVGLLSTLHCDARAKTDTVVLDNGNVVTGEVKILENGILRYSTMPMGTVRIEWNHVHTLDSNYRYRIRTEGGQRYFGTIGQSAIPGRMHILHAGGTEDVALVDIVAIKPIDSSLRERLDTSVSLGYSDYKASDSSTTTMGFNVTYDDEFSTNTVDGRWVVSDNSDETNKSALVGAARQRVLKNSARNFTRLGAAWETNDELAIDYRFGLSYGLGRNFIDSNRTKLALTAGLAGLTEEDSLGETTESLEGLFIIEFSSWRFDTPELDLTTSLQLLPGITETGRFRANGDIEMSWEIIPDFNFNITAFGSFDNESNEEGDDYDYGITTGIEWEL